MFGTLEVGGIFVNRQVTDGPEDYNRSWGLDANARLFDYLILHSYLAETHEPGTNGDNRAKRVSAAWRDAFLDASVLVREIGGAFSPGVGFVRRKGIRQSYATVGIHPRPAIPFATEINPFVEVDYTTDLGSRLLTRDVTAGLGVPLLDGSQLNIEGTSRYERLDDPFPISGDTVPAGAYSFREGSVRYNASAARKLSGQVRVSGGGYFQGERRSFGGSLIWRPNAHFAVDVGADHNVLDLTGEAFTVDVLSARFDYSYSTKLHAGAWIQYNDARQEVVTNVKVNFVHAPLSDLFVVYTERRDSDSGSILDRRFTIKFTKLFAF